MAQAASTRTYTFDVEADYQTGASALVDEGTGDALQYELDWTLTEAATGFGLPGGEQVHLISPESAGVLIYADGDNLWRSTNSGDTWADVGPATTITSVVEVTNDPTQTLVATGDDGYVYYSNDFGASWNPGTTPDWATEGVTSIDYVAYDPDNNKLIAIKNGGTQNKFTVESTDGGVNWSDGVNVGITGTAESAVSGGDGLWFIGSKSGISGNIYKSEDQGATWDTVGFACAVGLPPAIYELGTHNGYVFAAGENFLCRGDLTGDLENWTGMAWITAQSASQFYSTGDILFASTTESDSGAADGNVYASYDDGNNWVSVNNTLATPREGGGLVRLYNDDRFVWIADDDAYIADPYVDAAWAIPNTSFTATQLNSITTSYSALSESTEIRLAFGFDDDPNGTWYYHDGADWITGVGTDADFATDSSDLTSLVLNEFVITGPVYVRIYLYGGTPTPNPPLIILNELTITYNAPGGGPGPDDDTPPTSEVNELDEATNDDPLTVSVTAADDDSGVAGVKLYYTKSYPATYADQLIQYGAEMHGCPTECFEWEFSAPQGDGRYYFYSSAIDNAENDNFAEKFEDLPGDQFPSPEAYTKIDTSAPFVEAYSPDQYETYVPRSGAVGLTFSERVDASTFDYGMYYFADGKKTNASGRLGQPTWQRITYCDEDGYCAYPIDDVIVSIPYTDLLPQTEYHFVIRELTDKAGNEIEKNDLEPPANDPVWSIIFTTAPVLDPDLTQSRIEVTNVPNSGKFAVGSKVSFAATIKNFSDTPATLASVTIPIADGMSYCNTNGCSNAIANSGTLVVQNDNGETTLLWTGQVLKGADVLITFDARIDSTVYDTVLTQSMQIDDGVHETIYTKNVDVLIAEDADFSTSTKTGTCNWQGVVQTCTDAVAGTIVTYLVTVTNTGHTPANRTVADVLGNASLDHVSGPTGSGWDSLEFESISNSIIAEGSWQPGQSLSFEFDAQIMSEADGETITNIADISGWDDDPSFSTFVPGSSEPDEFPPMIASQSPASEEAGVGLRSKIRVEFTKSIDTDSFDYTVINGEELVNTSEWTVEWRTSENEIDDSLAIISLPLDETLVPGSKYTVEIDRQTVDTDGNTLAAGSLPNPWSFFTIDPALVFSAPTDPIIKVEVGKVSMPITISVVDRNTGEGYVNESAADIGILAETANLALTGSKRELSKTAKFSADKGGKFVTSTPDKIFHVTIPANESSVRIYLKDATAELLSLVAFPDPWNGWSAATKPVLITEESLEKLPNRLTIELASENVTPGKFSSPMTVRATSEDGDQLRLPTSLYFHTQSTTGRFYDSNFKELPDYISIQALNPQSNLQIANNIVGNEAVFYYKDNISQSSLVTISDNTPIAPDINLQNANALINVISAAVEDELLEDLVPVVDDTGRQLKSVTIDPTKAVLLPGGVKSFSAVALDTAGKPIDNAIFKWYVVAGGGVIEKDGVENDSHQSVFTAGEELGSFYDTILVATIYNGQFNYATASIRVADLADYMDGGLPTTGVSGIQLIFMVLTLAAAVALAWVEHYDKTLEAAADNGKPNQ